jgi:IS30 family transposase
MLTVIAKGMGLTLWQVWSNVVNAGVAPRPRKRRPSSLSEHDREEISRLLASEGSLRSIANHLGRAPSTISREVRRNGGVDCYRAIAAERRAYTQASRPQLCKLARSHRLCRDVTRKLSRNWSPEQIAAWLRLTFADDAAMQVSHETIYRTLYVQTRGALRKELQLHLRTRRTHRRPRGRSGISSASIVDGVSISERPAVANDRAVPGHWEGDLLFGTVSSCIATLVERTTRFVMLVKIPSKDTKTVTAALKRAIKRLPSKLRQSLTWDRGSELGAHKQLAMDADIDIFFCDPHSPWQRGTNENTNGLLRQYFPNGQDVARHDQRYLDRVARQLNSRPRETLGWRTPGLFVKKGGRTRPGEESLPTR